jgi:thiamine-phosphate pyrophosphorylase
MMQHKLFQIMDANLNRLREGLRVCEDIARFTMTDRGIAKLLKTIRHKATETLLDSQKQPLKKFILARDTQKDALKFIDFKKQKSVDVNTIFMANIERVKESLRVLEECSKILDEGISRKYRKLRFDTYCAEKRAVKRHGIVKYDADRDC